MKSGPSSVQAIYRYPVKGLSPQSLDRTSLASRQTIPGDRLYAIENGTSGFDPAAPAYLPKQRFLMLMVNERLAALRTDYDEATQSLVIYSSSEVIRGDLRTDAGRRTIESFFARYCADELRGPPRVLYSLGHSFSDVARKVVSIINLDSIAALERVAGVAINPIRFRGNIYVTGWPPWHEFGLIGQTLEIGTIRLRVIKRIQRCAAIEVNPDSGIRDLPLPRILLKHFEHSDCGVYAEVIEGGHIQLGDSVHVSSS